MSKDPSIVIMPILSEPQPTTQYSQSTVHEHRAPTDESVRLLREMEQAARDKVETSINVGGNGFECVINLGWEAMSNDMLSVAIFKLNGKQMRAEARVRGFESKDPSKLLFALRDEVAKAIASEILATCWPKAGGL